MFCSRYFLIFKDLFLLMHFPPYIITKTEIAGNDLILFFNDRGFVIVWVYGIYNFINPTSDIRKNSLFSLHNILFDLNLFMQLFIHHDNC